MFTIYYFLIIIFSSLAVFFLSFLSTSRPGILWCPRRLVTRKKKERPRTCQGLPRRKQISSKKKPFNLWDISFWAQQLLLDGNVLGSEWKCPWKIECFLEDLFLGSQWSIILGYRRLSVKSLKHNPQEPLEPWGESHEGYEGSWDCVCGFYR